MSLSARAGDPPDTRPSHCVRNWAVWWLLTDMDSGWLDEMLSCCKVTQYLWFPFVHSACDVSYFLSLHSVILNTDSNPCITRILIYFLFVRVQRLFSFVSAYFFKKSRFNSQRTNGFIATAVKRATDDGSDLYRQVCWGRKQRRFETVLSTNFLDKLLTFRVFRLCTVRLLLSAHPSACPWCGIRSGCGHNGVALSF